MQICDVTCVRTENSFGFFRYWQTYIGERSTVSWISKELLNDIFAEVDRSNQIKNFTDKLNLGELQVDNTSVKFTAETTKKYKLIR